jgi:hypothetical protein
VIAQAAGDTGNHQRADQADAVAHPDREVADHRDFNQIYNAVNQTTTVNPPPPHGAV